MKLEALCRNVSATFSRLSSDSWSIFMLPSLYGRMVRFGHVANSLEPDVNAAESLSPFDEKVPRERTDGCHYHHDMVAAKILGKRVGTHTFFTTSASQAARVNGMSLKCFPRCLHPNPKRALHVSAYFCGHHLPFFKNLQRAVAMAKING